MKKEESFDNLVEREKRGREGVHGYSPGITKRLLEKYKPSSGLKVIYSGRTEEEGRAA